MKQHLKKLGLHKKLFYMVNASSKFDMEAHKKLLQLIYWFNTINAVEVANEYNLMGGISISTSIEE
jgi:ribosomal 50S subunit-associated protein YjgA (DUF615 family)